VLHIRELVPTMQHSHRANRCQGLEQASNVEDLRVLIPLVGQLNRCYRSIRELASGVKPLYRGLASNRLPSNALLELTAHPHLHGYEYEAIVMSWKQSILDFFDIFGPASLAVLSFTESILQPIPPDLLYIPMLADAMGDTPRVLWLWLTVTLSSVAGSLVGYWIGRRWGRSFIGKFSKQAHLDKIEALTVRYGTFGIFIAAFSPIPYKLFGWVAGMGEMEKKPFIIAGLLGRGLRFGLEAALIGIYGNAAIDSINWFLDNEIVLGAGMIVASILGWYIWKWWSGIELESISPDSDTVD
jgi:membrane protein YqaA with SNARE-associated domain